MTSSIVDAVSMRLRGLALGLLDAGLPQTCVACGEWIAAGTGMACGRCHEEIWAALNRPHCPRCGRTLPRSAIHERRCARCRTEAFWNVAGIARVGLYDSGLRKLVLDLKYRGRERNADYLADVLEAAIRGQGWLPELNGLIPVPMHWLRRWQRPCDHAGLLAEALARRVKVPVVRLVRRAKHAPSQTGLTMRSQRFENVKGCFAPSRWRRPDLRGKTVCIIDNLIVSGATIHEVSKVLRKAGARRIYAAVIARPAAPGDPPSQPVERQPV